MSEPLTDEQIAEIKRRAEGSARAYDILALTKDREALRARCAEAERLRDEWKEAWDICSGAAKELQATLFNERRQHDANLAHEEAKVEWFRAKNQRPREALERLTSAVNADQSQLDKASDFDAAYTAAMRVLDASEEGVFGE